MKKHLPSVYQNKIEKDIRNNTDVYYSKNKISSSKKDYTSIDNKIKKIFQSADYVYKKKINITTKDNNQTKIIVGQTNTNLITIDNELIKIKDIIEINEI